MKKKTILEEHYCIICGKNLVEAHFAGFCDNSNCSRYGLLTLRSKKKEQSDEKHYTNKKCNQTK